MIKIILLSLLIFNSTKLFSIDLDNPLPNWLDLKREIKHEKNIRLPKIKIVPPSDFRIPAEYEPAAAVLISYAGYTSMLSNIAKAVTNNTNAHIWVMSGPSSMSGVPKDKYVNFSIPIDTVWMRDYGPFGLSKKQEKLGIVDTVYRHYQYRTDDDAVPKKIGEAKGINVYSADIILDGGNFMVDSYGNLFMTERTYIWNSNKSKDQVNSILKDYFKIKNIYTFEYAGYPGEPYDGTGHIDMFMKLLNDNTVLIADTDVEPFKSVFNKAAEFFKERNAPNGKPYRVLRVKGYYKNNVWYTYTNSLIVNGYVLMPSYSSYSSSNLDAQRIYEEAGLKVLAINSDSSITAGGSIHCVTQVIPDIGKIIKKEAESEKNISVDDVGVNTIDWIIDSATNFTR
ncbi:MAG: agmatine deiminase family protein [Elusimicrobiota bacterium]